MDNEPRMQDRSPEGQMFAIESEIKNMMKDYEVPFPCNGTWDRKAWWWLEQNIEKLEGDILFWNIGGNI